MPPGYAPLSGPESSSERASHTSPRPAAGQQPKQHAALIVSLLLDQGLEEPFDLLKSQPARSGKSPRLSFTTSPRPAILRLYSHLFLPLGSTSIERAPVFESSSFPARKSSISAGVSSLFLGFLAFRDGGGPKDRYTNRYTIGVESGPIQANRVQLACRSICVQVIDLGTNHEDSAGWGGRIRTCECRYQKPVPYHLATPQQARGLIAVEGGGGSPRVGRRRAQTFDIRRWARSR